MTATHQPIRQSPGKRTGDCGCHAPEQPCTLECLVRPAFFCGQLLTDQDMTALVQWTQNKSRLLRYRHGWGVVCGLDVRCRPHYHDQVLVTRGYAVDCCGNDVIVCDDTALSLAAVCRDEKDSCAELRKKGRDEEAREEPLVPGFDSISVPPGNLRVIDLYIRYREQLTDPQTALGRGVCKQVSECEYSRVREGFELTTKQVVPETPPAGALAGEGKQRDVCVEVVRRFREFSGDRIPDSTHTREWLRRWIEKNPVRHLCFLEEWICDPDIDFSKETNVVQALSWLVLDCRKAIAICDCVPCESAAGVPLARIWLECKVVQGRRQVRVHLIDAVGPFRRPIALDCQSASSGRFLWMRVDDARAELARAGVFQVEEQPYQMEANVADLEKLLDSPWPELPTDIRTLFVWEAGRLGRRVVDVGV